MFPVGVYELPEPPTFVPPDAAVYQPKNVYPFLVAFGNVIALFTYDAVNVPFVFPYVYTLFVVLKLPPPDSVHLLNLFVLSMLFAPGVPPFPLKLTVFLPGGVAVPIDCCVPSVFVKVEFPVVPFHVPPFGFTVNTGFAFHCAYKVTSAFVLYVAPG